MRLQDKILKITLMLVCLAPGLVAAEPLQVSVSILPLKTMVQAIGGQGVQVQVMVRPGANPATYEPSPRQMSRLTRSQLYFAIGVPFERAWLTRFKQGNKDLGVVHLEEQVVLRPMGLRGNDQAEPDPGLLDPHIWLSPNLVRTFSLSIAEHLAEARPGQAKQIWGRYLDFARRVARLDAELADRLEPLAGESFLVVHPSWGYFSRSYGLVQVPVRRQGKEPSPRKLQGLIQLARKEDLKTVFVQPQFSKKIARTIAKQIQGQVVVLDPLAEDWAANLRHTAQILVKELSGAKAPGPGSNRE